MERTLKDLLKDDKIEDAISGLQNICKADDEINELINFSARCSLLESNRRNGIIQHEDHTTERNKIRSALLEFINKIDYGDLNEGIDTEEESDSEEEGETHPSIKKINLSDVLSDVSEPETKISDADLSDNLSKFQENRIILIDCLEETVASSFAHEAKHRLEEKSKEVFRVVSVSDEDNYSFNRLFIESEYTISDKKNTICIVNLPNTYALFFDEFINLRKRLKRDLENRCLFVIISLENKLTKEDLSLLREPYTYWKIDFFDYYLKMYISNEKEAETYANQIKKQREEGKFWSRDDSTFFHQLRDLLYYRSLQDFIERIKENSKIDIHKEEERQKKQIKKIKALIESPLYRGIIYTATFFPNLRLSEFNAVSSVILSGEKEITKGKKGKKNEIDCSELWNKDTDTILKKCRLTTKYFDDTLSQIVDFKEYYIRDKLISYFKKNHPTYLHQKFLYIIECGLLYSNSTSRSMTDATIKLIVDMATNDPRINGSRVLNDFKNRTDKIEKTKDEFIEAIEQKTNELEGEIQKNSLQYLYESFTKNGNIAENDIEVSVEKIKAVKDASLNLRVWANLSALKSNKNLILRFSVLINEMLNYPILKNLVSSFLSSTDDRTVFNIITLGNLKSNEFDELQWVNKLIHNVSENEDISNRTRAYLLYILENNNEEELYETLSSIKYWTETKNILYRYSKRQYYRLIQDNKSPQQIYDNYYLLKVPTQDIENVPTKPLYEEKYNFLISWLYKQDIKNDIYIYKENADVDMKNVGQLLHKYNDDIENKKLNKRTLNPDIILGKEDLIETWFFILYQNEFSRVQAGYLVHTLVKYLLEKEDKKEVKSILGYWRLKKIYYVNVLNARNDRRLENRAKLRRKVIIELIKQYKIALENLKSK